MSREAALVLVPRMPWPLDDGGRVGLWQSVSTFARGYDTTLVTLVPSGAREEPPPAALESLGVRVVSLPHDPPPAPVALVRGTAGRWPYTLARYRSGRIAAALRALVARLRPRLAVVNHLHLATYEPELRPATVVLRQHNVESSWLERFAASRADPFTRSFARHQAARMRGAERHLCEAADLVLAIHEDEAARLRALAPRARIAVVPVGVDVARFAAHAPVQPPRVLLAGAFGWPPNREGAERFLARGWPELRARVPDAVLRVVGKDLPARDAAAWARLPGVEAAGLVPAIEPELAAASVMVVPLWVGAGMRVKIVEAMMAGVPVVATPLAAEGLGTAPGTHLLLADDEPGLGRAVAGLLREPARAASLAAAARAHALANWSLDAVAERTLALCGAASLAREGAA